MNTTINTGFLMGNLFDGDVDGIDLAASVQRYAEMFHEAIKAAYPDAIVHVRYQEGEGSLPRPLETVVETDGAEDAVAAEYINHIAASVYVSGEWYVDA